MEMIWTPDEFEEYALDEVLNIYEDYVLVNSDREVIAQLGKQILLRLDVLIENKR